jgi:hypothetical protein
MKTALLFVLVLVVSMSAAIADTNPNPTKTEVVTADTNCYAYTTQKGLDARIFESPDPKVRSELLKAWFEECMVAKKAAKN